MSIKINKTENFRKSIVDSYCAKYVLAVLVIVYVFNYIDRQILSILAEDVKTDLGITDAQLGFLYGTAFVVFYATFGIAFGRLADIWSRKKLISFGLFFWSLMTTLSGTSKSFTSLAFYRFGVGVGESSASPAAFSMLYDYFSPKYRTTVLAIYSSGVYIGAGLGLFLGGMILKFWENSWPHGVGAPFGLKGWQAAFMLIGPPGILMAFWVLSLVEPSRGGCKDVDLLKNKNPFQEVVEMLITMLPLVNIALLYQGGKKVMIYNLLCMLLISAVAWVLVIYTGDRLQWIALGIGVYAAFSWAQGLAIRDPVIFSIIFKCPSLIYVVLSGGPMSFMLVSVGFWVVPFIQREHGVSVSEAGMILGLAASIMGFAGIVCGGWMADKLRQYTYAGKLYVWLGSMAAAVLSAFFLLSATNVVWVYLGIFMFFLVGPMAHGPWISTVNDLVLPRGRATASALAFMVATLFGFALGPYITGLMSDNLVAQGVAAGEALRQAMLLSLCVPTVGIVIILFAIQRLKEDESSIMDRARMLGEPV